MLMGIIGVVALRLGVDDAGGDDVICQCSKSRVCVTAGKYRLEKKKLRMFMFGVWEGCGEDG